MLQLAGALAERDDSTRRARVYARRVRASPDLLRAAFGEALTLPMVYADAAAVARRAQRYARRACARSRQRCRRSCAAGRSPT